MKKETLIKATNAVANATPEAIKSLDLKPVRKYKEHTSYSSAFAIGEHAELCFDMSEQIPFGRIEGIEFGVNGINYTVAMAVNTGTQEKPDYEFHSGRPLVGVDERLLDSFVSTLPNDIAGKYPTLEGCKFQIGDTVRFKLEDHVAKVGAAIPVLIWGVSYTKGKVMYDVSIDADEYQNTSAYNDIYERYLKHSMDRVDSVFIQPIGGWKLETN
ncbi:hypothetical protein JA33_043 [Dickeya phage vB_DsoM_JA33]|uniref:Uncharacterized protein n=2 Tax=Salmondvirus JA11 TaxID=2734141 RepID=A0A386K532_9CAUD|nr:hypothetical protein HOU32_gp043 [Dickeya phage vB_DsoM_JA11]AXG67417.1 hypothetical protein JA33_043 [Dickeya phage vB_DsoM_JA33]AYD79848.1 hypothetical protein JA11_043 [Dickeya phage vB_DsoM_JA11]